MTAKPKLPEECQQYFDEYRRWAEAFPSEHRANVLMVLEDIRAQWEKTCRTAEGRQALARTCQELIRALRQSIAQWSSAQVHGVPASKPAAAPFRRIKMDEPATPGPRGVIFPKERRAFQFLLGKDAAYWTPDEQDVDRAEQLMADHLAYAAPEIFSKLSSYRRQYVGILEGGSRIIFVNAFCDSGIEGMEWRRDEVVVQDGGDCYFTIQCDLDENECSDLWINGEA